MKRAAIIAAMCSALISLTLACGHQPADVVKAYQEAYNEGDVDRLMSLYAEDARFRVAGLFDLQGREALRELAEYDQALHTKLEFSQMKILGDTVICQVKETNDWIETADIGEFYHQGAVVVRRGLISAIDVTFTPETDHAYRRIMMPLMEWARMDRPGELSELMPQGEFIYNAGNARKNLSLLREYKQNVHRQGIRPGWKKLGE